MILVCDGGRRRKRAVETAGGNGRSRRKSDQIGFTSRMVKALDQNRAEAELVEVVEQWLQSLGLSTNIEVPFGGCYATNQYSRHGQRWDVVAWDDAGRFLAVEVKRAYTEQALDQAVAMISACREVYVAVDQVKTSRPMRIWDEVNRDYGIGLIAVGNDRCEILVPARSVFPVRSNMATEMLALAKSLPREEAAPGNRKKLCGGGWRSKRLIEQARNIQSILENDYAH